MWIGSHWRLVQLDMIGIDVVSRVRGREWSRLDCALLIVFALHSEGDLVVQINVLRRGSGLRLCVHWRGCCYVVMGGNGEEYLGTGNITNTECKDPAGFCAKLKVPWASPGHAVSLGGGCGIFGGNPHGCPAYNDTRAPGSKCGQFKRLRGTFTFGSSALELDFPNAATTEMELGSWQDVAWVANGGHWGGYTYRLCKLPQEGKTGITEECFARNVLKFARDYTMMRKITEPGMWWKVEQDDLTQGTFPSGSAWRHVAEIDPDNGLLRKDTVIIPDDLPEGDYVLSFRWDTRAPQIWVSCANIRLVRPDIIG